MNQGFDRGTDIHSTAPLFFLLNSLNTRPVQPALLPLSV